jgi:hypothetical protein
MLTPGTYNDMLELIKPRKEEDDGNQNDWN